MVVKTVMNFLFETFLTTALATDSFYCTPFRFLGFKIIFDPSAAIVSIPSSISVLPT
jgi:hypothetical protein